MGAFAISSKMLVGLLSILFLAAAIGMWFIGGFVIATYHRMDTIASASYTLVPAVVIVFIGIFFVLGAISGLCGALRESRIFSLLFFVFVFLLFALLITAIVLSFVYKSEINDVVTKESVNAMDKYNKTGQKETSDQIDYLQQEFKCCGSINYTSWANTSFGQNHTGYVPVSCCKEYKKHEGNTTEKCDGQLSKIKEKGHEIYDAGCVQMVDDFLKGNLYYLGAGAIAFLVLLLFGMVGSCWVLWQRKEASYFNLGS